jgi:hypothetical protein
MQLARQRALMLLEMSKRASPELRDRLVVVAEMWLSLAIIDDQLGQGNG